MRHRKKIVLAAAVVSMLCITGLVGFGISFLTNPLGTAHFFNREAATLAIVVPSLLRYTFNVPGVLEEASTMDESSSPYFWLNSGGRLMLKDGFGETLQGDLPLLSRWRIAYNISNAADTDGGAHPQNLFRLITRSRWQNERAEAYFLITKDNLSASQNRNESNGLLLFSRYLDSNDLYYAGVRVDGFAVVKKKIGGVYYTLGLAQVFKGAAYARATNASLLPKNTWIGLRVETLNNPDGSASIRLFMDKDRSGTWQLVLENIDDGKRYGGKAITADGYAGIRTDFMDVQFQNYTLQKI
jgi:hypothetical protein